MHSSTFFLTSADELALFVYRWLPEATPKAVVQIAHGLVGHAGRYARLAEALTRAGFAVYAGDQRSHSRTAPAQKDIGFFAHRDRGRKCVDDLWGLNQRIATDHPGLPIVLIGLSMRSFMVQHFKGLEQLVSAYHTAGVQHVTFRHYPEARYELLNVTGRGEVTHELLAWLAEVTGHEDYSGSDRPQSTGRRPWA